MNNTARKIRVMQIRSAIRRPKWQTQILIGLGLKKLNKPRLLEDSISVRGMIEKIKHLVTFEVVEESNI